MRKNEVLRDIRKKHYLTIVYMFLICQNIFFGGLTVYCVILILLHRSILFPLFWFLVGGFIVAIIAFGGLRYFYRKQAKEESHITPYHIPLICTDKELLLHHLIEKLSMQTLPDENYYSLKQYPYLIGEERKILYLLFRMHSFDKKMFAKIRNKSTKTAQRLVGIKTKMSIGDAKELCRINIVLLDAVTEDTYKQISVNALFGMSYAVAMLTIYIDLESSMLLIPRYSSLWNGGSSKYLFCVKKLFSLL